MIEEVVVNQRAPPSINITGVRDMQKFFLKWSMDILYSLIPTKGGERATIYDPGKNLRQYRGYEKFNITERCSHDSNINVISCAVVLAHNEVCEADIQAALNTSKPMAVLTRQSEVSMVENLFEEKLGSGCETSIVHIHGETASGKIEGKYCWVLLGIATPTDEMIAVTPKNFLLGQEERYKIVKKAGGSEKKIPLPPVFTIFDGRNNREEISSVNSYAVRALAEYVTSIIASKRIENKMRNATAVCKLKAVEAAEALSFSQKCESVTEKLNEKECIVVLKSLYTDFSKHIFSKENMCTLCESNKNNALDCTTSTSNDKQQTGAAASSKRVTWKESIAEKFTSEIGENIDKTAQSGGSQSAQKLSGLPCVEAYLRAIFRAFSMQSARIWERAAKNTVVLLVRGIEQSALALLVEQLMLCLTKCGESTAAISAKKSLTYALSASIKKYSEDSGRVGVMLTEKMEGDKKKKLIEILKPFASQEIAWKDSPAWKIIAEKSGITTAGKIKSQGENCASIEDECEESTCRDPQRVGAWNTNGFKARWQESRISLRDNDPRRIKKSLSFKEVVKRVGSPDVFFAIESKITLTSLIKLKGFEEWKKDSGYTNVYALWSGKDNKEDRSNEGYAGIVLFSKVKPEKIYYGFEHDVQSKEGRTITAVFPTMVVIGSYSPCSGWGKDRQQKKNTYEKGMKRHIKKIRALYPQKGIVQTGDLNVNPRIMDCSEEAKAHWRRHVSSNEKSESTEGYVPGCRPEEIKSYEKTCAAFEGINVWETLYPTKTNGMHTWSQQYDPYGSKGHGQRIDHFVVSRGYLEGSRNIRVSDMKVHQGLGSSDHWPITLDFADDVKKWNAERENAIRVLRQNKVYSENLKEFTLQEAGRIHIVNRVGLPVFNLSVSFNGKTVENQECFLDTGSPFSIYNPNIGETPEKDPVFSLFMQAGSRRHDGCVLQGVGGSKVEAKTAFEVGFDLGGVEVKTKVLFLQKHEPTLPKLLLGLECLVDDFGGMYIMRDEKLGGLKCAFAKGGSKLFQGLGAPRWAEGIEGEPVLNKINKDKTGFSREAKVFKIAAEADRESTRDEWDDLCDEMLLEGDVNTQKPVVRIPIIFGDAYKTADVILDNTSVYNLVSPEFLEGLKERTPNIDLMSKRPSLVGRNGEVQMAQGRVLLEMKINQKPKWEEFYIWPELHEDIVIGNNTESKLKGKFDELKFEWNVHPEGDAPFVFKGLKTTGWKTSIPLKLKKEVILPPRSHTKVLIECEGGEDLKSFGSAVRMISPVCGTFTAREYKTAWGPCSESEWVQIANPTNSPIKLKKGERVADLSVGEGWEIRGCDLDPTEDEKQKEMSYKKEKAVQNKVCALMAFEVLDKGTQNKNLISPLSVPGGLCLSEDAKNSVKRLLSGSSAATIRGCCTRADKGHHDECVLSHRSVDDISCVVSENSDMAPNVSREGSEGWEAKCFNPSEAVEGCSSSAATMVIFETGVSVSLSPGLKSLPGVNQGKISCDIERSRELPEISIEELSVKNNTKLASGLKSLPGVESTISGDIERSRELPEISREELSVKNNTELASGLKSLPDVEVISKKVGNKRSRELPELSNIELGVKNNTDLTLGIKSHPGVKVLKLSGDSEGKSETLIVSLEEKQNALKELGVKNNTDLTLGIKSHPGVKVLKLSGDSEGKSETLIVSLEEKQNALKELGVDLTKTSNCRSEREVLLATEWCYARRSTITKDGKLDFTRRASHNTSMSIQTTVPNPVFKHYAGRTTPDQRKEIQKQMEEKLQQGIIEKSSAPWSSNCVCINKNGKMRIAVDYRKLNDLTVKDSYLLPTIQECLDSLHGTKFFTSVDCAQAYHQIPMATERDKDLTTFVVPGGGLYRYKYMPFGLCNAGAVWTRFIDEVLEGLRWDICLVYADDILIHTKSDKIEDHLRDLDKVFDRLDKFNVKVKGDKMQIALKELPFLGQLVGTDGCRPDPEKIKAVMELQPPKSVHQLRRVMGMFAYYRKFIKDFAKIAAPLYELTGKNAQNKRLSNKSIALNSAQQRSFEKLKLLLTTEPIFLRFPDWDGNFEVHCDASDVGVASVLWQQGEKGEEKGVVMYASKMLTPVEKKYPAYEKEALALVWSLELFRHYLRKKFKVVTDCRSLVYLRKNKTNNRVTRWILRLQDFDFVVKHRAGSLSSDCDGLTRQPLQSTEPYGESPIEPLYEEGIPFSSVFEEEAPTVNVLPVTRARNKVGGAEAQPPQQNKRARTARNAPGLDSKHTEDNSIKDVEIKTKTCDKHCENQTTTSFFEKDEVGWDLASWLKEQQDVKNKEIQSIRHFHEKEKVIDGIHRYAVNENKLFVLKSNVPGKVDRIVVPDSLKAFVLGQHHNLPLHAHQGGERMLKLIASRYYWPGMARDVKRWVNSCSSCARRKTTRNLNMGLTTPVLATAPWQVVGIDLVGKCVETTGGSKYVLTIVDHFTRWPIAVPIPDKKGETIAKALYQHLIAEHGVPEKMLSDQGKEFVNEGIATLCKKWGIKQVKTGGYNPQANGVCERFHRWMNTAMTQLYDRKSPDWDMYLPAIVFAYRVSANDSTGYSPFLLNTGREPVLPSDITFAPTGERNERNKDAYVNEISEKLSKAFALARDKQYAAHSENVNRKPDRQRPEYKNGDLVMLYSKTSSEARMEIAGVTEKREIPTKWRNPWKGPGTFLKKLSNTECEISLFGKTKSVNFNRIGPFTSWDLVTVSSDEWSKRLTQEGEEKKNSKVVESDISENDVIEHGDVFLFLMEGNKEEFHGFGVGIAINIAPDGFIHFQWMGNFSDSHSPKGTFRPGWIDTTKNQEYFRDTRERQTHSMFTGESTETKIHKESVVMVGRKKILTKELKFTTKALKLLRIANLKK